MLVSPISFTLDLVVYSIRRWDLNVSYYYYDKTFDQKEKLLAGATIVVFHRLQMLQKTARRQGFVNYSS